MANEVLITSTCRACLGTGVDRHQEPDGQGGFEWVEEDCENCDATGEVSSADGVISAGTKITGIVDGDKVYTYQISEATDASEWVALSDGNKDAYAMILSMGIVDLADGTSIRATLWAMFDSESTTRANLEALIA